MPRSQGSKLAHLIPYFAYKVKLSYDRSVAIALKIDGEPGQARHRSIVKTSDSLGRAAAEKELRLLIEASPKSQPASGELHKPEG